MLTRSPIHHDTVHRRLTAICVDGSSTVGHDKSAVGVLDMWTDEWALVSLSNAGLRHSASLWVEFTRTASHTFSAVSGRERWARVCRQTQGSGEEGEEQERHLEACSARQFCLPSSPDSNLYPHTTCDLFAPLNVTELSLSFYLALVHVYSHQFFSPLVWDVRPSSILFTAYVGCLSVKPKSLLSCPNKLASLKATLV